MGKKKRTNNKQNSSSTTMKNFDEKVLAREIIQAYGEFEQKKKFEIEKREQENQKEWMAKAVLCQDLAQVKMRNLSSS